MNREDYGSSMFSISSRNSPSTPFGVGNDEAESVLVVGQVGGDEEAVAQRDAFPGGVQQGAAVPEFTQSAVTVYMAIHNIQ